MDLGAPGSSRASPLLGGMSRLSSCDAKGTSMAAGSIVSVTRLRVRAARYLPPFLVAALRIGRQARASQGFIDGIITSESAWAYWTLTVWRDEAAMRGFRSAGVHGATMRRLLDWCDEASYVHWQQDAGDLPSLAVAHERMSRHGKLSKVRHPSREHSAGRTASERLPRPGQSLRR